MLVYALMNQDTTSITFHIGLEDSSNNAVMTFKCYEEAISQFTDTVLLDISIKSNNLFYIAIERLKEYGLFEVDLFANKITEKTGALPNPDDRLLLGSFI